MRMKALLFLTVLKVAISKNRIYFPNREFLHFGNDFQVILAAAVKKTFMIILADTTGTSLNYFTPERVGDFIYKNSTSSENSSISNPNFLCNKSIANFHILLDKIIKYQKPKLSSFDLYSSASLIDVIKCPAQDSFLTYVRRNETDQFSSTTNYAATL